MVDTVEQLSAQVRESATSGIPVQTTLEASNRIIARVTDGIYREPWAAFRELVANAYDADAHSVVIDTNAPSFDQVVIRDDGNGMATDTVAYVLKNIGGSSKRTHRGSVLHTSSENDPEISPGGRRLIGKIGIGLFAVVQLTNHFQIITKAKGENLRTSATVTMKTYNEDEISKSSDKSNDEDDQLYEAADVSIQAEEVPEEEVQSQGTTIVLYALRPEIRRRLQSRRIWEATETGGPEGELVERPEFHVGVPAEGNEQKLKLKPNFPWLDSDKPDEKFRKLFEAAARESKKSNQQANLDHFDEYLRLIWQLSLSVPLQYLGSHPFDITGDSGIILFIPPSRTGQAKRVTLQGDQTIRNELALETGADADTDQFNVLIDDIKLSRPIELPHELRLKSSRIPSPVMLVARERAPFDEANIELAGGSLEFEAYLYWNNKIIPKETAGALIRVREASGTLFDNRFLDYQVSEQTRLRQITAEIFVKEGLDSAINIDRESFNYSHPHLLYIQRWLHRALRLLVNRLKAIADEDLKKEKAERARELDEKTITQAVQVWERRLGEDADPPFLQDDSNQLVEEVGGAEIEWEDEFRPNQLGLANAIAVVLEAYGVLSNLNSKERARLVNDLIAVLDAAKK